jgi:hypothetical protein
MVSFLSNIYKVLAEKKGHMEKVFAKNQVKPGDEQFQYDIQKDFEVLIAQSWGLCLHNAFIGSSLLITY